MGHVWSMDRRKHTAARASWPRVFVLVLVAIAVPVTTTAFEAATRRKPAVRGGNATTATPPPLPIRNPQHTLPAKGDAGDTAQAAVAMWTTEDVTAALAECRHLLSSISADIEPQPTISAAPCGAAAPLLVRSVGSQPAVEISPPATLTCPMVAALATWIEDTVQPAARAGLGAPIVRISNASSYVCRFRNNARQGKLSEHAFANALDIRSFTTETGVQIEVEENWKPIATLGAPAKDERPRSADKVASIGPTSVPASANGKPTAGAPEPPARKPSAEESFLRTLHAGACGVFKTVLGPDADAAHRDHMHVDLAVRRSRATFCQ